MLRLGMTVYIAAIILFCVGVYVNFNTDCRVNIVLLLQLANIFIYNFILLLTTTVF
jgi:hypothetical protein